MKLNIEDIESGTNTRFWKAVLFWIDESLESIRMELEDLDGTKTLDEFKRLGGNAQSLRRIAMLPEVFMQNIEFDAVDDDIANDPYIDENIDINEERSL